MSTKYKLASMFSGCGGMDLGFVGGFSFLGKKYSKNPFQIVWANDVNEYACRTYEKNLKHKINRGDVWGHLDSLPNDVDVLVGGFPCQDISVNNRNANGINGARSGLYRAMVEAVNKTSPKIFIAENVRALLHKNNEESLKTVLKDFQAIGYSVKYQLLHAADYEVPQTRERVFIVGVKDSQTTFDFPKPILDKSNWISVEKAIKDLENKEWDDEFSHIWSLAKKSPDQGSRLLMKDRPAYTIRAECHGNIQYHYKMPRRMSMREAARVQTFPDHFKFHSKLRETERQVGNAVPPVLAWHMAQAVLQALES